jgi:hypothetical protein
MTILLVIFLKPKTKSKKEYFLIRIERLSFQVSSSIPLRRWNSTGKMIAVITTMAVSTSDK